MPCYDPPSRDEILSTKMPAVLCSIVSQCGVDQVLSIVNWEETGVLPGEFREWWNHHVKRDIERRQREDEQKRREQLRQQAKEKLTPEEMAALFGKK